VYRRDSIDATHYPVFHQMEGVRVYSPADWEAAGMDATAFCEKELKASLEVRTDSSIQYSTVGIYAQLTPRTLDPMWPIHSPVALRALSPKPPGVRL
jgi:hypothetical protein